MLIIIKHKLSLSLYYTFGLEGATVVKAFYVILVLLLHLDWERKAKTLLISLPPCIFWPQIYPYLSQHSVMQSTMKGHHLLGEVCREPLIHVHTKHKHQDWIRVTDVSGLVSKKGNRN